MGKYSGHGSDHNRGQRDRSNSTGGRGNNNYNPPGKSDPTGGFFMSKSTAKARDAYDRGWSSNRKQKG